MTEKYDRLARAKELAEKVKNGEEIPPLMPASSTFMPPRPVVKVNKNRPILKVVEGKIQE